MARNPCVPVTMNAVVALAVAAIAVALSPPPWLVRLIARLRTDIAFCVSTNDKVVALTLDDGPDIELTPRVLDVLRRADARATFFLIGSRAEQHPALVRRLVDEGHEVGNHLWLDERAAGLSDAEFERKLLRTGQALSPIASACLFRPGSGFVSRAKVRIAQRHGYRCVLGSLYPYDAQLRSARWITWRLRTGTHPGAIVILHEGHPSRDRVVSVLESALPELRRRGYRVVTASQLLSSGVNA
jgi:peptidoglycan-N-acetylglucosamine deacetylase